MTANIEEIFITNEMRFPFSDDEIRSSKKNKIKFEKNQSSKNIPIIFTRNKIKARKQRSFIIPLSIKTNRFSFFQKHKLNLSDYGLVGKLNERKKTYEPEKSNPLSEDESMNFRKKSLDDSSTKQDLSEIIESANENIQGSNSNKVCLEYELKLFQRGETIRRNYISKLIQTHTWQPNKKEKKHNSMIIFDWDDTLLCTSFLTPTGIFYENYEPKEKDKLKIKKLEGFVVKILNLAIEKGDTYIITNAAPGWVEYSAERFYPEILSLLKKVTIVSARGEYEKLYPGDSRQWKIQAFLEMKKNFDTNLVTNIICLGDSVIEMEAAHCLASKFTQAFIKTVKFKEAPKPDELIKQLQLVNEQFSTIYSSVKNLTVRVERKGK